MIIEARDISLIYDIEKNHDAYALKDIGLTIKPHEFLGILGPSGSGKSSLLYVLSGLKKATTGVVYYDGKDTEFLPEQELADLRRRRFGFIFQRSLLVDYLSVRDNILLPSYGIDKIVYQKADALLKRLGIDKVKDKLPHELSFGQKQRVAIARALVNSPEIIFADEPTASLDHKNAMDVMEVFREQLGTASLVVVTHDATILEGAHKVIQLWDGRIKKV